MPDYHAPVCVCGSLRFEPRLVMFPMRWWLTCYHCGKQHPSLLVRLKPLPPKAKIRRICYDVYGNPYDC